MFNYESRIAFSQFFDFRVCSTKTSKWLKLDDISATRVSKGEAMRPSSLDAQEMCFLFCKCFHWIFSEFTDPSEQDLVGKQWIHQSSEWGLINCVL
jgi:hypothetical protein